MKLLLASLILSTAVPAWACPDLSGNYMFSSSSTLEVRQDISDGVTTYIFTTIDENCPKCEYRKVYRANGKETYRRFVDGIRVESTKAYCSDGILHVRMKADTYDHGRYVATFTDNYDFSLNERSGLVEDEIKDGRIYRTSTHYRLMEVPVAD